MKLFVTATGTDIGKTVVTAALVRELRGLGVSALAMKPVASGVGPDLGSSDPGRLLAAMGRPVDEISSICPWSFEAPLAPDQAAAAAGRRLDFDEVVRFCLRPREARWVLIEGVGGVRVPIGGDRTVREWIGALGCPALLVAGTYLGSISHTLTAIDALVAARVPIIGLVLSRSETEPMPLEATIAALAPFLGTLPVAVLPRLENPSECPPLLPQLGLEP